MDEKQPKKFYKFYWGPIKTNLTIEEAFKLVCVNETYFPMMIVDEWWDNNG